MGCGEKENEIIQPPAQNVSRSSLWAVRGASLLVRPMKSPKSVRQVNLPSGIYVISWGAELFQKNSCKEKKYEYNRYR